MTFHLLLEITMLRFYKWSHKFDIFLFVPQHCRLELHQSMMPCRTRWMLTYFYEIENTSLTVPEQYFSSLDTYGDFLEMPEDIWRNPII